MSDEDIIKLSVACTIFLIGFVLGGIVCTVFGS